MRNVTFDEAMETGLRLGIDFDVIDFNEFWAGISHELEHGDIHPDTDVIPDIKGEDDLDIVGQIALEHIAYEDPAYYSKLKQAGID